MDRRVQESQRLGALVLLILTQLVNASKTIYFGHITSFGEHGFNSSGAVPAVELAVEHINSNSHILAGYTLASTPVMNSGCDRVQSLDAFFASVVYNADRENIVALLGCGCGVATEPVAEISYRWNITQISYASGSATLSNRAQFKNYFRTWPSFKDIAPALVSLLKHYKWKRVLFLTQNENLFTSMSQGVINLIKTQQVDISVGENTFPSSRVNFSHDKDFFGSSDDYRVFFVNMYTQWTNLVLCEAASRNMTYPHYAWIMYGWMPDQWWKTDIFQGVSGCSSDAIQSVLDRFIIISHYPVIQDQSQIITSGYNVSQYMQLYNQKRILGSYSDTVVHTFAYDAVWALALALNKTAEQLKSNTSVPGCNNTQQYTNITLDQFRYNNSQLSCFLKSNLQATNFSGASGSVYFDGNGTRIIHRISILQMCRVGSNMMKRCIGYIDLDQNSTYPFYDDCNETTHTTFPNGIPPDGTPLNVTSTNNVAMAIMYYVLASIGIILVLVCAVFNIAFRNNKVVRLTSPNLNYFILVGALLLYSGMYANIVLTTSTGLVIAQCHLQTWLVFLGYAFVLGTMIAKLWRVYHIFHDPTSTNKKLIYDWHLIVLVLIISGVQCILLFLGSAVPSLQPGIHLVRNAENPTMKEPLFGLEVYCYINTCYQKDTPSYYWLILLMTYTAFLQCLGMILAFQTRKVKISALNDSKYVAAIIYISSITLVTLVFTHFGFSDYLNTSRGILDGVIFLNTTAYLVLIFVPNMISLYKDPEGTKIFEKSMSSGLKGTLETKEVLAIGAELSPAVEKHGTPGSVVNFQDSMAE